MSTTEIADSLAYTSAMLTQIEVMARATANSKRHEQIEKIRQVAIHFLLEGLRGLAEPELTPEAAIKEVPTCTE